MVSRLGRNVGMPRNDPPSNVLAFTCHRRLETVDLFRSCKHILDVRGSRGYRYKKSLHSGSNS